MGKVYAAVVRWVTGFVRDVRSGAARKYVASLGSVVAAGVSYGLLPSPWDARAAALLVLLGTFGVYQAPNKQRGA